MARASIVTSPFFTATAVLILLAAFTKSAQVPFHFWLPNAMEAPTPVSAYLHSATMVKAGVYLIARMTPILGSVPMWTTVVTAAGGATMLLGAYRAVQETDLKRILAYSTLGALGVLTLLIGVGTRDTIVAVLDGARSNRGTLIASGFIAGGALAGVLDAMVKFFAPESGAGAEATALKNWLGLAVFLALGAFLFWDARRARADEGGPSLG